MTKDEPFYFISRKGEYGFTLIETLAVLLISGILVASLTLLTGQWLKSWDRGVKRLQTAEMLTVGINRIAADIETALPLSTPGPKLTPSFLGAEDTIVLVRTASERSNSRLLEFVKITAEQNGSILRESAPYDPLIPLDTVDTGDAVKLIDMPYTATFEFKDESGKWDSSWSALTLPTSVRVLLKGQKSGYFEKISIVIGTKINIPSLCVTATSYSACKALATGQPPTPSATTNSPSSNTQTGNQNQGKTN